jgi:hypothetical protein
MRYETFLEREYGELNSNIRWLADVRFKLLALVPVLGGVAVFVLTNVGLSAASAGGTRSLLLALLGSVLGFLASLGIVLYDQRNSELYNALIHRAKYLERRCKLPSAPGGLRVPAPREEDGWAKVGGQYSERPRRHRRLLLITASHDLALAFIYGPLLGAWFFPGVYSLLRIVHCPETIAKFVAAVAAITSISWAIWRLIRLDAEDRTAYHEAGIHNKAGNEVASADRGPAAPTPPYITVDQRARVVSPGGAPGAPPLGLPT